MQTSYSREMTPAFAGMKADSRFDEVESFVAEEELAFGIGVMDGTDPATQVLIADNAANVFRGITIHEHNSTGNYPAKSMANVLRKGKVRVPVTEAVAVDDDAYVNIGAGTGHFCKTTTSNLATGGKFRSATTGAGFAWLEINLP